MTGGALLACGTLWKDDSLSLTGLMLLTAVTGVSFAGGRRGVVRRRSPMTSLSSAGIGFLFSLVPSAGYTAAVINTLVLRDDATVADATRLGIAAVLVGAVTVPMVRWVLSRLDKVSDELVRSKDGQRSKELNEVLEKLRELESRLPPR